MYLVPCNIRRLVIKLYTMHCTVIKTHGNLETGRQRQRRILDSAWSVQVGCEECVWAIRSAWKPHDNVEMGRHGRFPILSAF